MKKIVLLVMLIGFATAAFAADDTGGEGQIDTPNLLDENYLDDDYEDTQEELYTIEDIYDPLEPVNRVLFQFNDRFYFWVLKPVKTGYSWVIPAEVRESLGNFFNNLSAPIHLVNNLLQGRFDDAGVVLSRFLINSTVGVYGLADVALQEYNLEPRLADFGQTLGFYGLGEGFYIVWPVIGPSNVRHSVGFVGDRLVSPVSYLHMTTEESVLYYGVNQINILSLTPSVYEEIKKFSLDPYVAARQSFFDFRRNVVQRATGEETDF